MDLKVRNSGINPFLVNPVKAVINGRDVLINHAYGSGSNVVVCVTYDDKYQSNVMVEDVEFLNQHELGRFKEMIKMLGVSFFSKELLKQLVVES